MAISPFLESLSQNNKFEPLKHETNKQSTGEIGKPQLPINITLNVAENGHTTPQATNHRKYAAYTLA